MSRSVRTFIVASVCALAIGLTGCLSDPNTSKQGEGASATKKKVVCVRDAPTGSHISQMVCYKQDDVEARRENDREKMRDLRIDGAVGPGGN